MTSFSVPFWWKNLWVCKLELKITYCLTYQVLFVYILPSRHLNLRDQPWRCTAFGAKLIFVAESFLQKYPWQSHCMKSIQIRSFYWSAFSCAQSEYGEILRISPYSVRMWENTDQKNLRIWTHFTQCPFPVPFLYFIPKSMRITCKWLIAFRQKQNFLKWSPLFWAAW